MDDETKAMWMDLGERLLSAGPAKFFEVLKGLHDIVEAQEIIQRFDWQLLHRGRPRKRYQA